MGRWSYSSKSEADNLKKIETSFLKKHGYFEGWRSGTITWTHGYSETKSSVGIEVSTMDGGGYLRIHYTQTDNNTGDKKDFDYKIPLTTTPCRYGGKRHWFRCPWYKNGAYCGRRVGVLYKDGNYFACRHCYGLTYSSKKQNRRYKLFPLFDVLTLNEQIDKLRGQIKRPYYAGRPTKKQRRLERLYERTTISYRSYEQLKKQKVV